MKLPERGSMLRIQRANERYSRKRRTNKWLRRKLEKKSRYKLRAIRKTKGQGRPWVKLAAPRIFNLLEDTNAVLAYFSAAEQSMASGQNVMFDLENVEDMSPETVALLAACVNDKEFCHSSNLAGNAPKKPELLRMLTESGFYDHVNARVPFKVADESFIHREKNRRVVGRIAKKATVYGFKHVFGSGKAGQFDPLFNTLIECMSNTHDHAALDEKGRNKWWLFVYSDPNEKITGYTFLDMGVGIFGSTTVTGYKARIKQAVVGNVGLARDLIDGKIKSRAKVDREIRGKGIPQMVEDAKSTKFKRFHIIANNVKIDLKTQGIEHLSHDLSGTLLHWELQP